MIQSKILFKGKLKFEDIKFIEKSSNRKIDRVLENKVDKKWEEWFEEMKKEGKQIYNGNTYRLNNFHYSENKLNVEIANIKFSKREPLRTFFLKDLELLGEDYFVKGLFVGGLIKTLDNYYIFGRRSGKTISTSKVDFIGGVLSKDEQVLQSGIDLKKMMEKEIIEETGIDVSNIFSLEFIGIVMSNNTLVGLETFVQLNLVKEEVNRLFKINSDTEMKNLEFISAYKLKQYLVEIDPNGYRPLVFDLL